MERYILTGTPGAGKTTLLRELARRGYPVVAEAATDLIAAAQARGVPEPWAEPSFLAEVVGLQRERQLGAGTAAVQLFDRSPVCTHALAAYLGRPAPPELTAELDRIASEAVYERQVLFVRTLGFVERTPVRQIDHQEALVFERLHEESYRRHGFELVEIPPAPLAERVALAEAELSRLRAARARSGGPPGR
ncbi:AAA family ATPase [Kitasatospora sp. NPDC002227]|uniref:AAA family ATPase n=1 Tax=Kitasatospora sp. NPDC002227 TaxID=3154773 RepID=UPI0033304E4C